MSTRQLKLRKCGVQMEKTNVDPYSFQNMSFLTLPLKWLRKDSSHYLCSSKVIWCLFPLKENYNSLERALSISINKNLKSRLDNILLPELRLIWKISSIMLEWTTELLKETRLPSSNNLSNTKKIIMPWKSMCS